MSPRWFVATVALVLGACSLTSSLDELQDNLDASSSTGGSGDSGGTGGAGGAGGSGASVASGASGGTVWGGGGLGGSGGVDPDADADATDPCAQSPTCASCCQTSHAQGAKDFAAAIQACVCQVSSGCASVCTDFCQGGAIDQACSDCVSAQNIQDCLASQCSSTECKAYLACAGSCPG